MSYEYVVRFHAPRLNESDLRDFLETSASRITIERTVAGAAPRAAHGSVDTRIIDFLAAHPGVHRTTAIAIGCGTAAITNNLCELVVANKIRRVRRGFYTAWGPIVPASVTAKAPADGPAPSAVLALLDKPTTGTDIAAAMNCSLRRATIVLLRLVARGEARRVHAEGRDHGAVFVNAAFDVSKITPYLASPETRMLSAIPLSGSVSLHDIRLLCKLSGSQAAAALATLQRLEFVEVAGRGYARRVSMTLKGAHHWQYDVHATKAARYDSAVIIKDAEKPILRALACLGQASTLDIRLFEKLLGQNLGNSLARLARGGFVATTEGVHGLTAEGQAATARLFPPEFLPLRSASCELLEQRRRAYKDEQDARARSARIALANRWLAKYDANGASHDGPAALAAAAAD